MTRRPPAKADTRITSKASVIRACGWGCNSVGIYYFHVRDAFGVVEDTDGVELSDMAALLMEVIRSAHELPRTTAHRSMRFEIVDANGRIVLVAPVQERMVSWDLMADLPVAHLSVQ